MINLGFERNPIRCTNEDKREHGRYGNLDQKKSRKKNIMGIMRVAFLFSCESPGAYYLLDP
jgi:hypothetical protein